MQVSKKTQARFDTFREKLAALNDIAAIVTLQNVGVFQALLYQARSADELARVCGLSPLRLDPLLRLACESGFLQQSEGRYALCPGDDELFDPEGELWPKLSGSHTVSLFARLGRAEQVLRQDVPFAAASTGGKVDADSRKEFLRYFHAWAIEPARRAAEYLCEEPFTRVLDLGCGGGTYSFALLHRMPGATATLMDRGDAAATVAELASEAGVAERVRFIAGDLLCDTFEQGMDLVFSSNLAHCLGFRENATLVQRSAESLKPGGRLVVKDYLPSAQPRQRLQLARFEMQLALFSESGQLYDPSQVQLWMAMSGLRLEATQTLDDSFLVVARKPQ